MAAAIEIQGEPRPAGPRPPTPEEPEGLAVPPEQRGRLDNCQRLAPGEAAREQDEREAERVRGPPRFHLPLAVQRELFTEKQILGS
jgi:hypothetical protein